MKRHFLIKKQSGKSDMTSVNLEKFLEYLRIQKSLRSENLTKYYLCKGIFYMFFSTLKDIIQAQSKKNPWISWNLMIICLKHISEEYFLFTVNVNASLKFLWRTRMAIRHLGTQRALGYSESPWALRGHLGIWRALGHLATLKALKEHSSTWALKVIRHSST